MDARLRARVMRIGWLLLACAVIAAAQDEEELARTIVEAPVNTMTVLGSVVFGAAYLGAYAAVLCITLSVLRLFTGFDAGMYVWIIVVWAGGMGIATLAHGMIAHHLLAMLVSVPAVFLLNAGVARFNDITWENALRVALVMAVAFGAYLAPPWLHH